MGEKVVHLKGNLDMETYAWRPFWHSKVEYKWRFSGEGNFCMPNLNGTESSQAGCANIGRWVGKMVERDKQKPPWRWKGAE